MSKDIHNATPVGQFATYGRNHLWQATMKTSLPATLAVMATDLPGQLLVNAPDKTQLKTHFHLMTADNTEMMSVLDMSFYSPDHFLKIHEVDVHAAHRRKGLGTIFLRNTIDVAEANNFELIELKASLENGPVFWALHGFGLDHEKAASACNFYDTVRSNFEDLKRTENISPSIANCVEEHLAKPFNRLINCEIASLSKTLDDGRYIGPLLLKGLKTSDVHLDLHCPETRPYITRTRVRAQFYAVQLKLYGKLDHPSPTRS